MRWIGAFVDIHRQILA